MQYGKITEVEDGDIFDMDDDGEYDTWLCRDCILIIDEEEREEAEQRRLEEEDF